MTYFCPALDPPLDGSCRKTTTLVRDLEYFIHTKFHQNPSSGSGEEVENVNSLTDDRRTTDGRQTDDRRRTTDAGQRVITIGHCSLWLLCPKNSKGQKYWMPLVIIVHVTEKNNLYILVEVSFIFQLLGKSHCWWTSESPRAHVAKFYNRLRLIRTVAFWEHQYCQY